MKQDKHGRATNTGSNHLSPLLLSLSEGDSSAGVAFPFSSPPLPCPPFPSCDFHSELLENRSRSNDGVILLLPSSPVPAAAAADDKIASLFLFKAPPLSDLDDDGLVGSP